METTALGERTLINLRGFCLYCLGRIDRSHGALSSPYSPSVAKTPNSGTPGASSSPYTPLKNRFVHSLPLEERIAPFVDLCRYLEIDVPDHYAFGDGIESESLTPPLCHKCHELTARLCMLQEELQYIQRRINNTVKRICKRVQATCEDQRRGALKREAFQREFGSKSKGLSRGRRENLTSRESKKTLDMLKCFQMKVLEKECLEQHESKQKGITLFMEWQSPPEVKSSNTPPPVTNSNDDGTDANEVTEDRVIESAIGEEEINLHEESETEVISDSNTESVENTNCATVVDDDLFLPSQTLLMEACTMESSIIHGMKERLKDIEDYKLKLQALSVEEEEPNSSDRATATTRLNIHNFRTPQEYYREKHKQDSAPRSVDSGERRLRTDSPNVTSRNHRIKVRRRLLLAERIRRNNEDKDDEEVVLPFE